MPDPKLSAPLKYLERRVAENFAEVEAKLRAEFARTPPPFYCSCDLRNNGEKIAPVDTNLFPGGFNNLPPQSEPLAAEAMKRQIAEWCPSAKRALLIPENHTRNLPYLDNVAALKRLLESAGIETRIARLDGPARLAASDGAVLEMAKVERDGERLAVGNFVPCAVILNNDLSSGIPEILRGLEIPTLPDAAMGWATRRKSAHFYHYDRAAEEFAAMLGTDPWLLRAEFSVCGEIDFGRREGLECLAAAVAETLSQIRGKYREHGVADAPFVVLKADAGTYGMGVLTVRSAEEVFTLNRRQRQSMTVGKEGGRIRDVLIQEGIRTIDSAPLGGGGGDGSSGSGGMGGVGGEGVEGAAEPVAYMIGDSVVGGFYRANAARGRDENLNRGGMSFLPLPFEAACAPPRPGGEKGARLYVYGVVARLALLAAAREIQAAAAGGN